MKRHYPVQPRTPSYVQWWLISTLGALGFPVGFVVGSHFYSLDYSPFPAFIITGLWTGVTLGLAYWFLLRAALPSLTVWLLVNILGWIGTIIIAGTFNFFLGTMCISIAQWLVLRRSFGSAGYWLAIHPFAMTVGFFAAVFVVAVILQPGPSDGALPFLVGILLGANLYGMLTGIAQLHLFREQRV